MLNCGIQKVTLIDYPGTVAAVLFFPGCNLRCPYCHNPELVIPPFPGDLITIEEAFTYLVKRRNVLGGVVLSGGEPLLNPGIPGIVERIRSLGLKVKIDTNGTRPRQLADIKPDYIAMDIKTTPAKYPILAGGLAEDVVSRVCESIEWIMDCGIPHEFRTVAVPGIVNPEDISLICSYLRKGERLVIAQFRPEKTLDESFGSIAPYAFSELNEMKAIAEKAGVECRIRGY